MELGVLFRPPRPVPDMFDDWEQEEVQIIIQRGMFWKTRVGPAVAPEHFRSSKAEVFKQQRI